MWKISEFKKANDGKHKYTVILEDKETNKKKTIHFGAYNMDDFTLTKNEEQKQRYIKRHQANEKWNNPLSAGFWSRWILWNLPTVKASLKYVKQHYNL